MICSCTSTENLVPVMHGNAETRLRENSKLLNTPYKNQNTGLAKNEISICETIYWYSGIADSVPGMCCS